MSETQTVNAEDLQERWAKEVPCGGNNYPSPHGCGRPAVLRRIQGCCGSLCTPKAFKCLSCWMEWYVANVRWSARHGYTCCARCGATAPTVDDIWKYGAL